MEYMKYNKLTLTFKNSIVENEFKEKNDFENRIFYRAGLLLSIGVWTSIVIASYLYYFQSFYRVLMILLGIILPLFTILIIITFFDKFKRHYQWSTAFGHLVTAFSYTYVSIFFSGSRMFILAGMIIMVFYAFFNFRFRFKIALTITILYTINYILIIIFFSPDISMQEKIINISFIYGALVAGIIGGYLYEKTSRKLFLFNRVLVNRTQEIEHDLDMAQYKLLQDRMSPHFLFNALNSIHSILENSSENADKAIFMLADMYRLILDSSSEELVSFEDEWSLMETYLDLEKLRFSDSLSTKLIVKGDFSEIKLPPICFQPIVENSIKHGQVTIKENGLIKVHASIIKDNVIIEFTDNGIGFTNTDLYSRSLGNIKKRLEFYYKDVEVVLSNNTVGASVKLSFYI